MNVTWTLLNHVVFDELILRDLGGEAVWASRAFDQTVVGSIPDRGVVRAGHLKFSTFHPFGVGKSSTSLTGWR